MRTLCGISVRRRLRRAPSTFKCRKAQTRPDCRRGRRSRSKSESRIGDPEIRAKLEQIRSRSPCDSASTALASDTVRNQMVVGGVHIVETLARRLDRAGVGLNLQEARAFPTTIDHCQLVIVGNEFSVHGCRIKLMSKSTGFARQDQVS